MRALAMAATVIFAVSSCGLHQPDLPAPAADMPPGASGSEAVVRQEGDATVVMEPARAVQEVVSPQGGGRCAIDAAKICAAYGQLAPAASDSMSVSAEPGHAPSDSITVSAGLLPPRAIPGPSRSRFRTALRSPSNAGTPVPAARWFRPRRRTRRLTATPEHFWPRMAFAPPAPAAESASRLHVSSPAGAIPAEPYKLFFILTHSTCPHHRRCQSAKEISA